VAWRRSFGESLRSMSVDWEGATDTWQSYAGESS
jgi:hypothetical protein